MTMETDLEMLNTNEQEESEVASPTEAEEIDLVALLDEGRAEATFYLPTKDTTRTRSYFITAKRWNGAEKSRYLSAGTEYRVPLNDKRRRSEGAEGRLVTDTAALAKMLVETCVVKGALRVGGQDRNFTGGQQAWEIIAQTPAPVFDWIVSKLREHQGIDVVGED